jgi:predicted metal-dependent peptidase
MFVLLHEYLHNMLCHPLRRGAREPETFNVAGDAIINALLKNYQKERTSSFAPIRMPKIGIDLPKYETWDIVSAYNDLYQEQEGGGGEGDEEGEGDDTGDGEGEGEGDDDGTAPGKEKGKGKGKAKKRKVDSVSGEALDDVLSPSSDEEGNEGSEGQPEPGEGEGEHATVSSEELREKLERDWQSVLITAAQVAKMKGKLPGCFQGIIDALVKPPNNWYEQLLAYFNTRAPIESSWSKFNRRFMGGGTYLPGLDGIRVDELGIGCDASGSVSDKEFSVVIGALNDAFDELKPDLVWVTQWDSHISKVDEYTEDDMPITTTLRKGYGGTDPAAFFRWVKENKPNTEIVVCITDGEFGLPEKPEGLDILWLVTRPSPHITYGTVIYCPVA